MYEFFIKLITKKFFNKKIIPHYICIIIIPFFISCSIFNVRTTTFHNIVMSNNQIIKIEKYVSKKRFVPVFNPYGYWIGSEIPTTILTLHVNDKVIKWKSHYDPLVISQQENIIFICALDLVTDFNKPIFKLYKFTMDWKEIHYYEFPKYNIVENIDLIPYLCELIDNLINKNENDGEYVTTAKIWQFLDAGIQYYEKQPSSEFVKKYKKQYINKKSFINPCSINGY
jgi:hypothetical protein